MQTNHIFPYLFSGSVGREKRAAKLTGGEMGDVCVGSGKWGSAAVSETSGLTAAAAAAAASPEGSPGGGAGPPGPFGPSTPGGRFWGCMPGGMTGVMPAMGLL